MKQILKKRTQFETALVRRVAKKSDFLRYAAYEMGLEQLRRKRLQRLSMCSDLIVLSTSFILLPRPSKVNVDDIGLCTRPEAVSNIRACTQEVQVRRRTLDTVYPGGETPRSTRFSGADHRTVGSDLFWSGVRLTSREALSALQLHPHVPSFYILAASHELSHMSPSAARSLLQRGLRLNSDSVDMWKEYIRMELGFIEGMRRRWNVLGINTKEDERAQVGKGIEPDIDMDVDEQTVVIDEQRENPPDEVIAAEKGGDEGEAARKAIMDGAIVKSALSSAAKGVYFMLYLRNMTLSSFPSSTPHCKALHGTRSPHSQLSVSTPSSYHTLGSCLFPFARGVAR